MQKGREKKRLMWVNHCGHCSSCEVVWHKSKESTVIIYLKLYNEWGLIHVDYAKYIAFVCVKVCTMMYFVSISVCLVAVLFCVVHLFSELDNMFRGDRVRLMVCKFRATLNTQPLVQCHCWGTKYVQFHVKIWH